jgi:hypothetical protein
MSGIFIDGKFCENSDLVCKRCNSLVWEMETKGNYCQSCNHFLSEEESDMQNPFYFPRVAVAYIKQNNEYEYLKESNGEIIIFENQMIAESALLNHNANLEEFYFVEIDYMTNSRRKIYAGQT